MREPRSYTVSILRDVLPKYCRGLACDVGAGRCKYKTLIERYAKRYIAVDNRSSTRQFSPQTDSSLDIVADVMKLPLMTGAADTVICTQVIEHVPEPDLLLSELVRICRRGGHVILATPWMAPYHAEPLDYYRFSRDAFCYLFQKHDLEMVELISNGGVFTWLVWIPLRFVELQSVRWRRKLGRVARPLELVAEFLDSRRDTSHHSIGYLAVGRKR